MRCSAAPPISPRTYAGLYVAGRSASVVEDVIRDWVCELLGLPGDASIGLVTGAQMGIVTALAAARFRVLERAGWDVNRDGLAGAPRVRVLVGAKRHVTIDRALRLLGLGAPEARGAWLHVDGAFGLWAAASPALRHLARGVERGSRGSPTRTSGSTSRTTRRSSFALTRKRIAPRCRPRWS